MSKQYLTSPGEAPTLPQHLLHFYRLIDITYNIFQLSNQDILK
uniref:Uncharacterized protein n=1 Tax=Rhizophora mucronata TaxID=61149 RepID=A0A2P2R0A6_RHIMU